MPTYIYDTELCHSKGPWKKHSYIKKIGEGRNAVYIYNNDYNSAKGVKNYLTEYNKEANKWNEYWNSESTKAISGIGNKDMYVYDPETKKESNSREALIKDRANTTDWIKEETKYNKKIINTLNNMRDKDSADFMSREKRLKENSKYWEKQKEKKAREDRLAAAKKRKEGWAEEKMIKNLADTEIKPIGVKKADVKPITVKKATVKGAKNVTTWDNANIKSWSNGKQKIKDRKSKGKNLVNKVLNVFKKDPPPVPTLSNPNGKILKENILKENILKESSPKKKWR